MEIASAASKFVDFDVDNNDMETEKKKKKKKKKKKEDDEENKLAPIAGVGPFKKVEKAYQGFAATFYKDKMDNHGSHDNAR